MKKPQQLPYVPDGLVEALKERFVSSYPKVDADLKDFIAHAAYSEVIDQLQAWKTLSEKKAHV